MPLDDKLLLTPDGTPASSTARFQLEQLPEELLATHVVDWLETPDLLRVAAASKLLRRVVAAAPIRCLRLTNIAAGATATPLFTIPTLSTVPDASLGPDPGKWLRLLRLLATRCPSTTGLELIMCDIPSSIVSQLACRFVVCFTQFTDSQQFSPPA